MVQISQGETLTGKDRLQYVKDVTRARNDPVWFAEEKLGLKSLFPKQKEVLHEYYRHLYDPNSSEYKKLVWVSGQRCLSGETLIATRNGLIPLADLYPKGVNCEINKDLAIDLDDVEVYNGEKWTKAESIVYAGEKKKCILTTDFGYKIECSKDHKFVTFNGNTYTWKSIKELTSEDTIEIILNTMSGDDILIDQSIISSLQNVGYKHDNNYPSIINEDICELVGYLIADGDIASHNYMRVEKSLQDEDIVNNIKRIVNLNFNSNITVNYTNKNTVKASINSVGIRSFFEKIGLPTKIYSRTKEVPWFIMENTPSCKSKYISAHFSCDGFISVSNRLRENGRYYRRAIVSLTTTSHKIAQQMQTLLLEFGIYSALRLAKHTSSSYVKDRLSIYYTLTMEGEDVFTFYEKIGFKSIRKQQMLVDYVNNNKDRAVSGNKIPVCKELIYKHTRDFNGHVKKGILLGNRIQTISKRRLLANYNGGSNVLDRALSNNTRYVKVKSIEYTDDLIDMYDLYVPEGNCYVANGFLTHNSGKTVLASIILCYEYFYLMSLENPAEYYGLLSLGHGKSQPIACTCVAVSSDQAKDGVYTLAKNYMDGNEWFEQWWPKLKFKEDRIDLAEKNIFMQVKASRMDSSAGFTNKICVFDELDLFAKTDSKQGARMVYDKLVNSTQTFGIRGKVVAISSLQGIDGIMSELYNNGQFEPTTLTYKLESWVANPNLNREVLMEEYKYRMDAFWRDFANRPEVSTGVVFPGKVRLNKSQTNVFTAEEVPEESLNHYHTLAADPAYRNDAFGMAVGYVTNNCIVIDGVNKFQKTDENKAYINPSDIENYIFQWVEKLNVDTFLYDTDVILPTVEKLENDWGINCIKHVAGEDAYSLWVNLNDGVGDYELSIVYDEYLEREANQLIKKELPSGKIKYDHVYNSSKDVADCCANLVWHLANNEGGTTWSPTGHMSMLY